MAARGSGNQRASSRVGPRMLGSRSTFLLVSLAFACTEPAASPASTPATAQPTPEVDQVNPWAARAEQALDEAGVPGTVVVLDLHDGTLATAERVGRSEHPATTPRSPASTVKPLLALAALHEHLIDPAESITCEGKREIDGEVFVCFASHGPLVLADALATSCNVYAYELAVRLGLERIHHHFHAFGLADDGGVVPRQPATAAMAAVTGIGHGELRVSPVQLARAYAALATGVAPAGHADEWTYSNDELQTVKSALRGVVESANGTAHGMAIPGLTILGKTGTSDHGDGDEAYRLASFAGWAGVSDPEIVVVVQLETDGTGGDAAAPVARRVFEGLLEPSP